MKTLPTSHPKFKQLMTLFTQTKQIGFRHTVAFNASKGRTESTRELYEIEVDAIIKELQKLLPSTFTPKEGDAQRKKMIAIAGTMRWGNNSKEIVAALNNWCLKQKYKKQLMKHTPAELSILLVILETKVLAGFYEGINK